MKPKAAAQRKIDLYAQHKNEYVSPKSPVFCESSPRVSITKSTCLILEEWRLPG